MTFSQTITKDSVTISKQTFKEIIRDLRKCDLLNVAYIKQSIVLDSLIFDNEKMFKDYEKERKARETYQGILNEKEQEYKSLFQKPNNGWILPTTLGVLVGVFIGVSI